MKNKKVQIFEFGFYWAL